MNTLETTAGNAYTKDPDYAAFTGRLVRTVSTVHYDPKLKAFIKRTCEYIDVGRPDTVAPVDCDVLIEEADDSLFADDENSPLFAAWQAKRETKIEQDARRFVDMRAAFSAHGPMTVAAVSQYTDAGRDVLLRILRAHPDVFCQFGYQGRVWGLHGQTFTEERKITNLQMAIRDVLVEHGPMTAPDMGKILQRRGESMTQCLKNHDDWFHVVGVRPPQGQSPATYIWGLVGVHDRDAA